MRRLLLLALTAIAVAAGVVVLVRWVGPALTGDHLGGSADTVYPLEYGGAIRAAARHNHLDPALVAAVIYVESGFDEHARSARGAVGLMQVLPETAAQIARETGGVAFVAADLEDPAVNVRYGSYFLRRELDTFGGDTLAAVAAYNAGAGPVARWVAAARAAGHKLRAADIPYPETRAYVQSVLRMRRLYRQAYGDRLRRTS